MSFVGIAVDQKTPSHDLFPRPGGMVLLRITPQRRGSGIGLDVLGQGEMQGQTRNEPGDFASGIAKQPERLRLAMKPMVDQFRLPSTLGGPCHGDDQVHLL
jgi:hypothetical protein